MSGPFRWEADCLADDPFAGDFGNGEVALSDKMVTNRKGGVCHTCAGPCEPGTRNRVLTERGDEGLETFRWCQPCCFAMAVYGIRPSIGDARYALGEQRRAELRTPHQHMGESIAEVAAINGSRASISTEIHLSLTASMGMERLREGHMEEVSASVFEADENGTFLRLQGIALIAAVCLLLVW